MATGQHRHRDWPCIWRGFLDVDPRNGGDARLEKLQEMHGPLPDTWKVATGGGGSHYFFRYPTNVAAVKSAPHAAGLEGVEVKSDRAYVVAPPSIHETGRRYAWEVNGEALTAAPPEWMIAPSQDGAGMHLAGGIKATADLDAIQEQGAAQGGRDNPAMQLLGRWMAQGEYDPIVLATLLLRWNELNDPPIGAAEGDPDPGKWALDKVRSVLRLEARNHED